MELSGTYVKMRAPGIFEETDSITSPNQQTYSVGILTTKPSHGEEKASVVRTNCSPKCIRQSHPFDNVIPGLQLGKLPPHALQMEQMLTSTIQRR